MRNLLKLSIVVDPDPYVFGPPGSGFFHYFVRIRILPSKSKNSKKNLHLSLLFCDFLLFIPMKTDVNIPSKNNKQKNLNKKLICVSILSATEEKSRIRISKSVVRIRTKMSQH